MATTPTTGDLVTGEDSEYFSIQYAAAIINALWGIVQAKSALADDKITEAMELADGDYRIEGADLSDDIRQGLVEFRERTVRPTMPAAPVSREAPVLPPKIVAPTLPDAPVLDAAPSIPMAPVLDPAPSLGEIDINELQQLFWNNRDDIMERLKASFREFAAEWFPEGDYFNKATAWLDRALGEGGTGVNVLVEQALWERDRARLTAEAARAEDEALTMWAGRGYTLPPGALNHAMLTVRQGLNNALSSQSRDIAIKAHQDELENARLAVQQAIGLRNSALASCINYMQALTAGPQIALAMANAQVDAQTKMANARADMYKTVTSAKTAIYSAVANTESDVYKAITSAKSNHYSTEVGAKSDMYKAMMQGWATGATAETDVYRAVTGAEADSYRTMVDALTRLYATDAQVAGVPLDAVFKKAGLDLNVADANLKAQLSMVDAKVRAAIAAAQQVATQASAALNNLNVSTGVSNTTSTSYRQN